MKAIELIKQPANSSLCGQACVAMVARVMLRTSVVRGFYGRVGKNSWKQVANALDTFEVKHGPAIVRRMPTKLAIVRIRFSDNKGSHYVVFDGERWLDPALFFPMTTAEYFGMQDCRRRISSSMEIKQ